MANDIILGDPPQPSTPIAIPARDDLIRAFLAGRSRRTAESYADDLGRFAAHVGAPSAGQAVDALIAVGQGEANRVALGWRNEMVDRGLSPATVARRLAALRSCIKLARMLGLVAWQLDVQPPRAEAYRDTRGPDATAWRTLLEAAKARAHTPIGLRDVALIRLLHDLALRRAEAIALDLADVDLDDGSIRVVGKGRREPIRMTLPDPVRAALAAWLAARGPAPGAVFIRLDRGGDPTRPGRLNLRTVNKLVGTLGLRSGLARPVKPHGLRHSGISAVLDRSSGNVRAAQRFSRHEKLETLLLYDDAREDMAGRMASLISDE